MPAGFPRYLAEIDQSGVVIQSTSTGAVISTALTPDVPGWQLSPQTVAAAPDGRTFYVAYDAADVTGASPRQIWIYQLTWSHGGSANSLSWIRGNPVPGSDLLANGGSMTVSPDGTRLALTAASAARQRDQNSRAWPDEIIVINLRTGARSVWQGGLYRSGKTFRIPDVSWTADGRSIVFLGKWCNFPAPTNLCSGTQSGPNGYRDTQVRSLSVGTGGGALDRGALLLSQSARYPVIAEAIAGPDPGELTLLVLSGQAGTFGSWSKVAVERVSAVTGSLLGVEYRVSGLGGDGQQPGEVGIVPDPSGRYLLLTYAGHGGGRYTGWIEHRGLQFLPLKDPNPRLSITAW